MFADLLTQPVTIVTASPSEDIDAYGNETPGEASTDVLAALQQQARSEKEGAVPTGTWLLVLPPGTDIAADDVVISGEERYQVDGPPWRAFNMRTGTEHHVEATLVRTAGGEQTT